MAPVINLLRFAFVAAVFMGWQVFQDGPLAYYIAAGLLIAWLAAERALTVTGKAWAIYAWCSVQGITTSACGGLYAAQSDARHFLCDRGAGLPVSLFSGLLALAVVLYLWTGAKNG